MRLTIPLPNPIVIPENANSLQMQRYRVTDCVNSIASELSRLRKAGYTHVVNMPGDLRDILYYAKRAKIVVLDHRMYKAIADYCASKS